VSVESFVLSNPYLTHTQGTLWAMAGRLNNHRQTRNQTTQKTTTNFEQTIDKNGITKWK
jgi:hypothetical protein